MLFWKQLTQEKIFLKKEFFCQHSQTLFPMENKLCRQSRPSLELC